MLYARLWNKNIHNLQEIVRSKLEEKNNKNMDPQKSISTKDNDMDDNITEISDAENNEIKEDPHTHNVQQ